VEVPSSNLSQNTNYSEDFHGFLPFHERVNIVP
jgi:hypothetical protein